MSPATPVITMKLTFFEDAKLLVSVRSDECCFLTDFISMINVIDSMQ